MTIFCNVFVLMKGEINKSSISSQHLLNGYFLEDVSKIAALAFCVTVQKFLALVFGNEKVL